MNIVECCQHEKLLAPFLTTKDWGLSSWNRWFAVLSCLYGLKVPADKRELIRQVTGRDASSMPKRGFDAAVFITGRRSGKSRIASVIGAYEGTVAGHEKKLAKGEKGLVAVVSPTRDQSDIVTGYLRAIFDLPAFKGLVASVTKEQIELTNNIAIRILTGSFRSVRGYTLVAAILDELAFYQVEEEGRILTDEALVQAIEPALITTRGKIIGITTPHARKGWVFKKWQQHFGNPSSDYLIVNCPSRTLNPTLPQSVIDRAYAEDLASAKAEYGGEFRDDVSAFVSRETVERLVVAGRTSLVPQFGKRYKAFVDLSGGRHDDAALAIAHLDGRVVVLDYCRRWRPPFSPTAVIEEMAGECQRYGIKKAIGDHYGAEFVARAFDSAGLKYAASQKPKSALYVELLPRLSSGEMELLDDKVVVDQIASLERRTRAGGKDIIDHPPNGHDDLANAVAGVAVECTSGKVATAIPLQHFAGAW